MEITRKIFVIISLVAVIPFLVTCYLFIDAAALASLTAGSVILITSFIVLLGMVVLISFTRTLKNLYCSLSTISQGEIDHKAEVKTSSGIADLAMSINQVSQRLRENADELEKRAILIERSNQELQRTSKIKSTYL